MSLHKKFDPYIISKVLDIKTLTTGKQDPTHAANNWAVESSHGSCEPLEPVVLLLPPILRIYFSKNVSNNF